MHYFIDTYGADGYTKFEQKHEMKKVYGYPHDVMTDMIEHLSLRASERGIKADFIHCFLNNAVKGVVFPEIGKGIINIMPYEERGLLSSLDDGYGEMLRELQKAKEYFKAALAVHDEWEKYYIDNLDFNRINEEGSRIKGEILDNKTGNEAGKAADRFLGAATANGPCNYIENLTADIKKRYFIKGRPGTGKSTFLKKIVKSAISQGFDVERYHCSLAPDSLDMVIIRSLHTALFDSTAPHEHSPSKDEDEVIDFYEIGAKRNVDREFKEQLGSIERRYKEKINSATECIASCSGIIAKNEADSAYMYNKKNVFCIAEIIAAEIFG